MSHDYFVQAVGFSPDAKYVVSGGDQTARVWAVATGQEIARMTHVTGVTNAAFSPDAKNVVSVDYETASVWEALTGREVLRLKGNSLLYGVAFSPDSQYVAVADDLDVHIWEIATGKEIAGISHEASVHAVAFSDDNKYLISETLDHTVHRWLFRPDDLIADACARVTRNLTSAEWDQFIGAALPRQVVCPNLPLEPEPITSLIILPTPVPTETLNP
jgi:WD40 repeat protein